MASIARNSMNYSRQQGAVLLVGLLILLLATLISVAAMNNSNLQERMASNAQNLNQTFQTAQSAIDNKMSNIDYSEMSQAIATATATNPTWPTSSFSLGNSSVTTTVTMKYRGEGLSKGNSMTADEGASNIPPQIFELLATSQMSGNNAASNIVQGFIHN